MTTVPGKKHLRVIRNSLTALFLSLFGTLVMADTIVLEDASPALTGRLSVSEEWPAGRTVLLLHGTLSHRDTEIIESLEALFSEADYSTLAINLSLGVDRRNSALPCESAHTHRESDALEELQRWFAWLDEQGVSDTTLVGHSRGANQALRYTLNSQTHAPTRLILVAPPQWNATKARDGYEERHAANLEELIAESQMMIDEGRGTEFMSAPVGLLYCADAKVTASSFASYYGDDPLRDTPTALENVELPVLVAIGSEDSLVTGLSAAISKSKPSIPVIEVDGADHFFRDLYADELVDIAVDFIEDTP